jgi:hypothetical protein
MTSMMHLKHGRGAGNGAYRRKGTISRVMVASRPKVSFWPDGSTSTRNFFALINNTNSRHFLLPASINHLPMCRFWSLAISSLCSRGRDRLCSRQTSSWICEYNIVHLHPVAHRYYTLTFFFRLCAACQCLKHFIVFSTLVTF